MVVSIVIGALRTGCDERRVAIEIAELVAGLFSLEMTVIFVPILDTSKHEKQRLRMEKCRSSPSSD